MVKRRKRWSRSRRLCLHDADKAAVVRKGRRMIVRCMSCGKVLHFARGGTL